MPNSEDNPLPLKNQPWWVWAVIAVMVGAYWLWGPRTAEPEGPAVVAEQPSDDAGQQVENAENSKDAEVGKTPSPSTKKPPAKKTGPPQTKKKRPLPKLGTPPKLVPRKTARPQPTTAPKTTATKQDLGVLKPVGRDVFETTAGLRYGPGSREGHRLKHIMKHAEDQPNRPGSHGVFDNGDDRVKVLAVIDEAYLLALQGGSNVKTEKQERRVVYTVNLKRRIGYVGGQTGKRRNKPAATHVRLVLEGKNVITAFPLKP